MKLGGKMLEKMLGMPMPDLSGVMEGYEFVDGIQLKAKVDYKCSEGDLLINNNIIRLFVDKTANKEFYNKNQIITTLTLDIKPPQLAFVFFLCHPAFYSIGYNIITSNNKKVVVFNIAQSKLSFDIIAGKEIGYGYFIPFTPINTIKLTNLNATT